MVRSNRPRTNSGKTQAAVAVLVVDDYVSAPIGASLGIRIEVSAVPARTLPRYELKARRVVRRETPGG